MLKFCSELQEFFLLHLIFDILINLKFDKLVLKCLREICTADSDL